MPFKRSVPSTEPFLTQTKSCLSPLSPFSLPHLLHHASTALPCHATYAIHTTNSNHNMAKCLAMPSTCKTTMPCHLRCQPCHAIDKIAMLHPFILTAMPCHSHFHTMPLLVPHHAISAKRHLPCCFDLQTCTTAETARCHNVVPSP